MHIYNSTRNSSKNNTNCKNRILQYILKSQKYATNNSITGTARQCQIELQLGVSRFRGRYEGSNN